MLNVLVLGLGQCGNRILDAMNKESFGGGLLFKYYGKQKYNGHVETIAINTAVNDLKELRYTKARDRIHVPFLHGMGANRSIGKKCFEDNKELLLRVIEERGHFDVAFIISSASGGTGSSFLPPLIEVLKEKYKSHIYSIIVLPFREEGSLYLQNSVLCLKEVMEGSSDGNIIVDNQFLKHPGKDIKSAYDGINTTIAERLLFLMKALGSEMMMVTDLGDLRTVLSGGGRIATMGLGKGDRNLPIRSVIRQSLSHAGLLFGLDPYNEANRAMLIIEGDRRYLDIVDIAEEVKSLSCQVFKGVLIRSGAVPRVLSVLSISRSREFEKLLDMGIDAINREREKKEFITSQSKNLKEKLSGLLADSDLLY